MAESQPSQPDTQPVSQPFYETFDEDRDCNEDDRSSYWGRLYPTMKMTQSLKAHDLVKKNQEFTVGRVKSCDVCIEESQIPSKVWGKVSKIHFSIAKKEENVDGSVLDTYILKDYSLNGTFVNQNTEKVGKGRSVTIKHGDIISIAVPDFEVYHFFIPNSPIPNSPNEYPQKLCRKFDVVKKIGNGAFGEVSLVFHKNSRHAYAMKTILKSKALGENRSNELKKMDNELLILRNITHPNVIQLVDDIDCPEQKFLILELMQGKDLFDRISSSPKKRLSEDCAKLYFYQIALGVKYLHSQKIIHRDLKPENVLLASSSMDTVVKITDFGLSKILESQWGMRTLCGTRNYVAPEVLSSEGLYKYNSQVDIWSMGVILYVCLSGNIPFYAAHGDSLDSRIIQGKYSMPTRLWSCVSPEAKILVKKMLVTNPDKRITIDRIVDEQWLLDGRMREKVYQLTEEFQARYADKEGIFTESSSSDSDSSPPSKRFRMDISDDDDDDDEDDFDCDFDDSYAEFPDLKSSRQLLESEEIEDECDD